MGSIQYTKDLVNQVKDFISENKDPVMARSSLYKFKKRFSDGTYSVKDGKLLRNGKEVVAVEDVDALLARLQEDSLYMQTTGVRLFNRLINEFEGISRSKCIDFINTKRVPQTMKRQRQIEVTPIATRMPREQFNIDYGSKGQQLFKWKFALPIQCGGPLLEKGLVP
jgi:hypothetical protein